MELKLLKIEQVAELLQCSDKHIRNMLKKDQFVRPIKCGKLYRWEYQSIVEWIKKGN